MRHVLIGPRGCGKTSIGRRLAEQLRCDFIDLDDLAAAHFEEPTVKEIWAKHGEAAWRSAEVRALREALLETARDQVIALGGGTPMIPQAKAMLIAEKSRGLRIIYLKCAAHELVRRLNREPGDRPSLTDRGAIEEIAHILAQREPEYEAIADVDVNAALDPNQVVNEILK